MRLLCIGECMVELSQSGPDLYRRGFAGDTFNTAWYAKHLMPEAQVAYASGIGTDAASMEMAAFMEDAGIVTDHLRRVPDRSVGLYMISTKDGERSFSYWRDTSAARTLADDGDWLRGAVQGADAIHFSGITLAILTPEGRERLCAVLADSPATVSFDTNLRPRLWGSEAAMKEGLTLGASVADIVLPSFDEEEGLFGDPSPEATARRYESGGAGTVVVKNGAAPVTLLSEGEISVHAPTPVERVVDTTAAGDSFAAGFLAARMTGESAEAAVARAMALSARVIGAPGALVADAIKGGTA